MFPRLYRHEQWEAAPVWVIKHGLYQKALDVVVYGMDGVPKDATVIYVDQDTVQLSFHVPTAGVALLVAG